MYFLWRRPLYWTIRPIIPIAILILFVLVFFWAGLSFLEKCFNPSIAILAEAKAKQEATEIINGVIKQEISRKADYDDLMKIHKDDSGRPVMIQPNIIKIDRLQAEAITAINRRFAKMSKTTISIPFGQVTGNKLLGAMGPDIEIQILPIGTVKTELLSNFDEAGFNQTRHRLTLRAIGEIQVILPELIKKSTITTDVLIADNILIGPVPQTLLNLNTSK